MKKLTLFSLLLFSAYLLIACAPKTEEDQIAAINKQIAPDGYVNKTHLYIHWPAVYTEARQNDPGGKEVVPSVTLKIPIEYLAQSLISFENAAKIKRHDAGKTEPKGSSTIDYYSRINQAILLQKHQITGVYLRLMPGAKPYVLALPYKSDSPEVAESKFNEFASAYAVIINRNDYHAIPINERAANNSSYEKPPTSSCVLDTNTYCHVYFGLKGRHVEISGVGESLENYYKYKAEETDLSTKNAARPISKTTKSEPNGFPKWREKVDPTQSLLNSFILSEDSPQIKGMSTGE